jgi:hypothetical protein
MAICLPSPSWSVSERCSVSSSPSAVNGRSEPLNEDFEFIQISFFKMLCRVSPSYRPREGGTPWTNKLARQRGRETVKSGCDSTLLNGQVTVALWRGRDRVCVVTTRCAVAVYRCGSFAGRVTRRTETMGQRLGFDWPHRHHPNRAEGSAHNLQGHEPAMWTFVWT